MNDNNGCGCYFLLMAIGAVAWIAMNNSQNSSGGSSNTTPATQTSVPYTPPSNYTPTFFDPVQQIEPVRHSSTKNQMMPMMKGMMMGMNKVWMMVEMAIGTVQTMMILVVTMITMKQSTKKVMNVAMMKDIQKENPNTRMKKNLMKKNS